MTRRELAMLFGRERARFARTYPWVAHATLRVKRARCVEPHRCAHRDLAFCDVETGEIVLLERALDLPRANIVGLLRHELGHLSDLRVHRRGSERRADAIARRVTGRSVYYDADRIQTTERGTARPRSLPR